MTQKNRDRQYDDYDRKFKEVFYIGILGGLFNRKGLSFLLRRVMAF